MALEVFEPASDFLAICLADLTTGAGYTPATMPTRLLIVQTPDIRPLFSGFNGMRDQTIRKGPMRLLPEKGGRIDRSSSRNLPHEMNADLAWGVMLMQLNIAIKGLLLFLLMAPSGFLYPATAMAQQNKCREHVVSMAKLVIEYQKTSEMLAQTQEELEELESRADALTEDEQVRFLEVRSEVVELSTTQHNLFDAISRKSKHVTEFCSE
jgi:hypothetical protein